MTPKGSDGYGKRNRVLLPFFWFWLVCMWMGMAYKYACGYEGTPAKVFLLKEFPWSCGAVRRSGVVMPCYADVILVLG